MKKLKNSASFLCLCVVIILTSLAFFYQKGNTTDGTVGSDSPDKENTLKPSASKGSDEFVNDADASEHSQSSHAEIDYSTYESTTLGISISYPAALQDIMAMAAVAWYYCAGNSVYYWTKAYDMSATQFAIAVSERIGRTITASDVAQAIRQKEVDAMMRRASQAIYIPG